MPPPQRLGPYRVLGRLGAGGMGEVWLARDSRLEREVALKVLPSRMTADSDALALFRNEALALATLNHPNIATIHGLEEIPGGTMVLVLERVEGETLAHRLAQGTPAVDEAMQVMAQVAQALEVAHERGIVHRDLKPGNIMIGPRGLVKVLDFGLAKRTYGLSNAPPAPGGAPAAGWATTSAAQGASLSGPVAGTPGYMSPEQVLAGTQDARTDAFAFGCVLYECLTGRRAFPADDPFVAMAQVLNESPDLGSLPPRTPPAIRAMVEACLQKEAESRPGSMRALRHALEEALGIRRAAALREGERVTTPHNLPAQATSFVGRQSTLAECVSALAGTRHLTLSGLGGSGKTRLAVELATQQLEVFHDGVWFVDVAPLADPGRLVESLAGVLGVRDEAGHTLLDGVLAKLAPRHALVLLDNAETHPTASAALASALLRGCPQTKVLVTSREPLGGDGETILAVPSLGLPGRHVHTAAEASASEAVRLFVERAHAAAPAFALTDQNAADVAEICRRVDGIPLALELAAARVRMLSEDQIRARLGDRFKLLARSGAGAPARQQTVLAVIQWSWDHLLEPEQDLLRRLAVFSGGWTLERATAVCSDDGDEFAVLDVLTRLVERSLVVVQHGEEFDTRYRFLESVWRFAQDKLEGHLEQDLVRERHFTEYLQLATKAETELAGPDQTKTLRQVAPEEENLLSALGWAARAQDGILRGMQMACAVNRHWTLTGRFQLARRVMEEALARDIERKPTLERSLALARIAGAALTLGDTPPARSWLEESLEISRKLEDLRGEARALAGLGVLAWMEDRFTDALEIGRQSLKIYWKLGQKRGVAMTLHNIASLEIVLAAQDRGRGNFEEALKLTREVGDTASELLVLAGLISSLVRLGETELAQGRIGEMASKLAELSDVGGARESIYGLEAVAEYLVAIGRPADAALALGAASEARRRLSMPHSSVESRDTAVLREALEAALGREEVETRLATGSTSPLNEAFSAAAIASGSVQPH
jgi:non-specific serine/threonine protein kinase